VCVWFWLEQYFESVPAGPIVFKGDKVLT